MVIFIIQNAAHLNRKFKRALWVTRHPWFIRLSVGQLQLEKFQNKRCYHF